MIQTEEKEPRLEKPGAGLPFLEWAIANYILFPIRFLTATPQSAIDEFANGSKQILKACNGLSKAELNERRLVPRLRGLEDSSRFWSVAMSMEHLIIVNGRMRNVIVSLSKGVEIVRDKPASTADVKPSKDVNAATIYGDYENSSNDFIESVSGLNLNDFPQLKFAHPWFGELNAKQWLMFAAPHQEIHRKQIEEIIKRL